jgi:uncharacterized RDD family membrane protein YckC
MAKATSGVYAGFWIRFVAALIDGIILGVLSYFLFGNTCEGSGFCIGYNNWQMVVPAAYFFGFWAWKSATPGAMALGLQIVGMDGKPVDVKTAGLRLLGSIVSGIAIGIGFIWIGFDEKKQGWHDKIAKTFVVKANS